MHVCVCACVRRNWLSDWWVYVRVRTQWLSHQQLSVSRWMSHYLPPWGGFFIPVDHTGQNKKPEGNAFLLSIEKFLLTSSRRFRKSLAKLSRLCVLTVRTSHPEGSQLHYYLTHWDQRVFKGAQYGDIWMFYFYLRAIWTSIRSRMCVSTRQAGWKRVSCWEHHNAAEDRKSTYKRQPGADQAFWWGGGNFTRGHVRSQRDWWANGRSCRFEPWAEEEKGEGASALLSGTRRDTLLAHFGSFFFSQERFSQECTL